jgi:hypothetical protein
MDTAINKKDNEKTFQIIKNYHYAEIYYVDAESEEAAMKYIEIENPECDEIYQDFDFYDIMEVKI